MQPSIYSFYKRNLHWLVPVALFVLAALVYLPLVTQFGFLKDDWYLMYDARVQGPGFFSIIFARIIFTILVSRDLPHGIEVLEIGYRSQARDEIQTFYIFPDIVFYPGI